MKYKHIVFDIDGTLIDTEYAVINSLIKTITEITGSAPQYESLKFALGITGRNAMLFQSIFFLGIFCVDLVDVGFQDAHLNMKV